MLDGGEWSISGTYLEACNCEAICPCRRVGGVAGGRSTYGVCAGALSWAVNSGHCGDVNLSGLSAVMVCRYDDDEPGSPWTFFLYIDERADEAQQQALVAILTGERGGSAVEHFPWAWKESRFLGWRPVAIEIDHTPGRGWFRAGGRVEVRVRGPVADQAPVSCVIPGHGRGGTEEITDVFRIEEGPLSFDLSARCAFELTFAYASTAD